MFSANSSTSLSQAGLSTSSHSGVTPNVLAAKNTVRESMGEPGSSTTGGTCIFEMNMLTGLQCEDLSIKNVYVNELFIWMGEGE